MNLRSSILLQHFFLDPAQSLGRYTNVGGNIILGNTLQKFFMMAEKSYISLLRALGIKSGKMIDHHDENLFYGYSAESVAVPDSIVKHLQIIIGNGKNRGRFYGSYGIPGGCLPEKTFQIIAKGTFSPENESPLLT